MTSTVTEPGKKSFIKAKPDYTTSELYDSPEELARWPLLSPLLKTWQAEVWEKDHTEFRGCWHYDQEAIRLQWRHKWAVILAAIAGTGAVVFAILQLGLEGREDLAEFLGYFIGPTFGAAALNLAPSTLMYLEITCLVLAVGTILISIVNSLDHRWRELRFKAEHYRMLKFRYLHDARRWLAADEDERGLHLFTHLAQIHSANRAKIREWIHWKTEVLPLLESPKEQPEEPLAKEIAGYFRERRLIPQRQYFHKRGHQLHGMEKMVRWVGPGLFWGSIACASLHLVLHLVHVYHESPEKEFVAGLKSDMEEKSFAGQQQPTSRPTTSKAKSLSHGLADITKSGAAELSQGEVREVGRMDGASALVVGAFALALFAAILPVIAAGIRTWRGAFEFGRNSLRFESMAHHLEHLLNELEKAQTAEAMLTILRRGEYAMENEHRAWMRLMMEAEWFG